MNLPKLRFLLTFLALAAFTFVAPSVAQEEVVSQEVAIEVPEQEVLVDTEAPQYKPENMPSVLFMFWEHSAIKDAKRARGVARPPTEDELAREIGRKQQIEQRVKPPPEARDITLGGIVYRASSDWTIWLNGKRVTPDALPEEVIDIRVFNEYIELKWYDDWTNQIFPIRMKAHQRFNIDTRIFLPG